MDERRLRRLVDVGRSLITELDPEAVFERLLEVARELTGARYAAIGVLDERRERLERFLTSGIDEDTHRAIGDLPRGRGVLGVLISDPQPLRLADVGAHPQSYGFPLAHPPMTTFLGVPIVIDGRGVGEPLPDREGRRRVHRRRRGGGGRARRLGGDRDRQRAALPGGARAPRRARARRSAGWRRRPRSAARSAA